MQYAFHIPSLKCVQGCHYHGQIMEFLEFCDFCQGTIVTTLEICAKVKS